jgi:hypothetical protein
MSLSTENFTNLQLYMVRFPEIPYLAIHLVVDDVVPGLLPVAVPHGLAGRHHVFPHALRRPHLEHIPFINIFIRKWAFYIYILYSPYVLLLKFFSFLMKHN